MVTTGDMIQLLPDHVANQIAAGEVIQRPASVVKELMENAVDAGATQIDLIVKDAGRTLIQLIDNGAGMSVTDLRLAFERHATSKIRTTEDIFHIRTKGFRGEALPSIAAIAQVEAVSRTKDEELGNSLIIEGSKVRDQAPVAAAKGTSISVKNLFYNVPARRNFLKSNQVEFRHIQEEFLRVALAHIKIDFRLIHNNSDVYILKSGNLKQRISQIFGRKIEEQLVPVKEETEIVKINGFIGKPERAKKNRGEQYFFVNQRFIKSNYLHKAVMDAFENLLPNQYVPSYFLFLEIDPTKIDINIHPAKTEIKFEEEYSIYAVLRSAVKHSLGQFNVTPTLDFEQNPEWAFIPPPKINQPVKSPEIKVDRNYNPFSAQPAQSQIRPVENLYRSISEFEKENNRSAALLSDNEVNMGTAQVMQWQNKYLVTQYRGELLIIDQNRAHQLILFDKFKKLETKNSLSQRLLFPIEIQAGSKEVQNLKNIEIELVNLGFELEFKNEIIYINATPTDIRTDDVPGIFSGFLDDIDWHDQIDFSTEIAKIIAKNSAVKKGEALLPEQALFLVESLFKLDKPAYSPYGKPIFIQFDDTEISKKLN